MKTTSKLIFELNDGVYDEYLGENYTLNRISEIKRNLTSALRGFERYYGPAEVTVVSAPFTVPLIGDFTESQNGAVLSAAIDQELIVVLSQSEDRMVHVFSERDGVIELDPWGLKRLDHEDGTINALVRGVLAELKLKGFRIDGFNAYIYGEAPFNLDDIYMPTWEAAFISAVFVMFNEGYLDKFEIARIGQTAFNSHFNKPSGIARQLAAVVGDLSFVDFKNPALPISSKVSGDFLKDKYAICLSKLFPKEILTERVNEASLGNTSFELAKVAQVVGTHVLRGLPNRVLIESAEKIRDSLGDRALLRAFCFSSEVLRALEASSYIITGETDKFLETFKASGDGRFKYIQSFGVANAPSYEELAISTAISDEVLFDCGASVIMGDGTEGINLAIVTKAKAHKYIETVNDVFGESSSEEAVSKCFRFSNSKLFRFV